MKQLQEYAAGYGLELTAEMLEQFELYYAMLVEWNGRMNLTTITERHDVIIKHFLDSIAVLAHYPLPYQARLIDVGPGAGFPSIPIKIVRPDLEISLLDSLQKRTVFLQAVSDALGQKNQVVHGRAEEFGHNPEWRGQYDFAIARAVSRLNVLLEYCIPFVKCGGVFLAMKGPEGDRECEDAANAMEKLGCAIVEKRGYLLPGHQARQLICIENRSQTSPLYPRKQKKITNSPL
ncbi:16S rRNA (guanine(527)-N(7))-methyltransferase RsmG [Ruminococcaceae bacterium OttesenSCG-928-L11]|nr:16S rRNA (guanine(527)-N(7))-methyltransferase RsmG [Ruminococcaceae bacterium OttesenSCG-928-L11]